MSSDRDVGDFNKYYDSMSFYALPYGARDKKDALTAKYGVKGIPTLVLLNGEGEVLEQNIRGNHDKYL